MTRTRFAPSPTGYLHIGGVRTALFSWLYARKQGGQFILRIEDTDRERSTDEAIQIILEGMKWLGLDFDEGPYYQTQHFDRYQAVIRQLLDEDKAYRCFCSKEELDGMREKAMSEGRKPRYDGRCRNLEKPPAEDDKHVIRFKNPSEGEVIVNDLIQGAVVFSNSELDDLIIARSDGTPTYNLTVVVDDMDMDITDVIRGDDHLNNTPRQINLFRAMGANPPAYAHVPLILGEDGKRLSKRHGAASILHYRDKGYLPEALLNYLVRLGWSHGDQEIFTIEEMIALFDIKDVNKSAASINPDKLMWLNQHYIKTGENERLTKVLGEIINERGVDMADGPALGDVVAIQKERVKTMVEMADQSYCFYSDFDSFDESAAKKHLRPVILVPLESLREQLFELKDWNSGGIHCVIQDVAEKFDLKMGKIAQPLRVAVTGGAVSPSIDDTLWMVGKQRSLARMDRAIEYIRDRAAS
ncbi:MAG: glutamate--tRNA ligase [Gammaproteobacteria bacterium]